MMKGAKNRSGAQGGRTNRSLKIESLEARQLLAADGIANGDFAAGLTDWADESSVSATASIALAGDNPQALLRPTADGTARISQQVAVEGGIEYRLTGRITSADGTYGYLGVKGFDGKWSEATAGDNASGEQSITFTTAADTTFGTVYAQAYKQQTGEVGIDDLQLLPTASLPPDGPPSDETPPAPPTEPPAEVPSEPPSSDPPAEPPTDPPTDPPSVEPTENSVSNGDFTAGLSDWVDESSLTATASAAVVEGNPQALLQPTAEGTARISQQVAVEGGQEYQLTGQIISAGGAYGYLGVKGFDGKWSESTAGDNVSGNYNIAFTTAEGTEFVTVYAQAYKQQTGSIRIDAVSLVPAGSVPPAAPPVDEAPADPPVEPPTEPPTDPPAEPPLDGPISPGPDASGNWVQGGDFATTLDPAWDPSGNVNLVSLEGQAVLQLTAAADSSARVVQQIAGLKPETLYTFAARIRTEGAWASFGVDQGTQLPKTNAANGEAWQEKRFIFYTGTGSTQVRVFLEAYQGEVGPVYFDDVRIIEGTLPLPTPPEGTTWSTPPELPELVAAGEEMIANADFAEGLG
ncbi:MAG: hypothetical protein VX431_05835, partial [Planctomycetota bacterium]|nr:hypothetical protein [Planctomycetota bacterium]